ncbi:DUF4917 family protein [Bacillus subtilis]|uniref:DUF4917 family protein n=1 Tax=Bacillus subtilis TaxID=1423 RepID=UPI001D07862A|nr:DUF4917 family protein [Bacillus subtilis]MCB7160387.1 DUF4917 family protein [Bacillus subtilis]MCB7458615.1 DUF4917 family protein [Bacillus subtilis]
MTELYDYKVLSEKHPEILDNLLTGNGFSIEFDSKFRYGGLYEYLQTKGLFKVREQNLFKAFETTNFEQVLNSLLKAHTINKTFGKDTDYLDESYQTIKDLLIMAVKEIHPEYWLLDINKLAWSFNVFKKNIFTTNYDLLSYWALLALRNKKLIRDGFWPRDDRKLSFQSDTLYNNHFKLYYLHGALHLYEDRGDVIKITSTGANLMDDITKEYEKGNFPVYVSEGASEKKLAQIKSNNYLSYCYHELLNSDGGITIIGQGLNPEYDKHLIDAIKNSKVKFIAYGVFDTPDTTKDYIVETTKKHFGDLEDKELLFYDSKNFFESIKEMAYDQKSVLWGKLPGIFPKI